MTIKQAMASVGTGDVGLFSHSIARAAPGIPPFEPDLPADVWEAVEADVRQHVLWHTDRAVDGPRATGRSGAHHARAGP